MLDGACWARALTSNEARRSVVLGAAGIRLRWDGGYGQAATPTPSFGRSQVAADSLECSAPEPMIMVLKPAEADEQLTAAGVACPACGGTLAPWGYARSRSVRDHHGEVELRPRRARCRGCRTTHVLLPAYCLPRRAVTVEIVGAALLAKVNGASHRTIAADLGLDADTVRGWIRQASAHASWLFRRGTIMVHEFDPDPTPIRPAGTALGDALAALGAAAAAAVRRLGGRAGTWELIAQFTGGRLLTPIARSG